MKDFLKVYNAKLHVLSPTFVGSGKEISKKEYRLSYKDQKVIVYDPAKFYQVVSANHKTKEYEGFLLNDARTDLNGWMKANQLSSDIFKPAIRYTVDFGDRLESCNSKVPIMEFSKDPYDKPYVPGTGIKGMLRTILLGYEIKHDLSKYRSQSNRIESFKTDRPGKNAYSKEIKEVENTAFNTLRKDDKKIGNAVNDIMQGLVISDSKPLSCNNLVLCQKIDYHPNKEEKPLNLLRECLRPGVDIEFSITIDTQTCKYSPDTIMQAIKEFNEMYYDCFLHAFGGKARPADTVYLGGGVGFVSKTIIYPMFGSDKGVEVTQNVFKNTLSQSDFYQHGHGKDVQQGVSPHVLKCTRYKGLRFQMGMCRFEMTEI